MWATWSKPSTTGSRKRRSPHYGQRSLLGRALPDPAFEQCDPIRGPCAVARHGAVLHLPGDGRSVGFDVGVGPQIECTAHRIPILFPEQRLDVGVEADLG